MIDSALMVPDILGLSDQIGQQLQVVVDALIRGLRLLNVLGRIFLDRYTFSLVNVIRISRIFFDF